MIITDNILKNGFLLIVSGLILDLALAMDISLDMVLNISLKKEYANPPVKTTTDVMNHSNMPKVIISAKKFSIRSRPLHNHYNIFAGRRAIIA